MEKTPHDIILRPIITERSIAGIGMKKYTFQVAKGAGKIEIRHAVEKLFPGTKVKSVNTMHVPGRKRRQGATSGYTSDWKKAIVTLTKESQGIEFFESMT
jgi:Ribosomal protein L23